MKAARVLVLGCPGSGKTRFAKRLSEATGLPVFHLDDFYWHTHWSRPTEAEWRGTLEALVARPRWIIDGNYFESLDVRLPAADLAMVLRLPRTLRVRYVLQRSLRRIAGDVSMLPRAVRQEADWKDRVRLPLRFLRKVWDFDETVAPEMDELITERRPDLDVVRLNGRAAIEEFLSAPVLSNRGRVPG